MESVITQVRPPEHDNGHSHGNSAPPSSSGGTATSEEEPRSDPDVSRRGGGDTSKSKGKGKKKAQRSFFRSLVCCLGLRGGSSSGSSHSSGGSAYSASRLSTEEGHPLQSTGAAGGALGSSSGHKHPHVPGGPSSSSSSSPHGKVSSHPASPASLPSSTPPLLPPLNAREKHKKCIVIDLDETLVHSSFKPINNADFIVPVEIDGNIHQVYVLKRPYVDEFLCKMGELYECILFTASLAKYADPVADLLDKWEVFTCRLFRESCVYHRGNYVKDLGRLGRELHKVLIVDNSPASYIFHPENAIPVVSWFEDMNDRELLDLIPLLENLSKVESVFSILQANKTDSLLLDQNSIKKKENILM